MLDSHCARRIAVVWLTILLTPTAPAFPQILTGDILGNVTDQSGGVVAGVLVTVQSPALLAPRSVTTGLTGGYHIAALPIGTYSVVFEIDGFKRVLRERIRVEAGFNASVDVVLVPADVQETVTVSVAAPIVDPKRSSTGETFSRDQLDLIPSARDPWAILEQSPNVLMDRQNVGGNKSGDQAFFTVHGGNQPSTMWNVDGVTITDLAQTGASSTFYDFDSFDEIRINTAGNDASLQTGGVNINLITRSGGNVLRGSGRIFGADKAWQSDNVTDQLRSQGAGAGNPVKNISDYGVEIGGPIRQRQAWFWGAYARQDVRVGVLGFLKPGATDPLDPDSLETDHVMLRHYNGKVDWQWRKPHKMTLLLTRSVTKRSAVNASTTRPPETTQRQLSPTTLYKLADQWVANSRWLVEAQVAHIAQNILFDFHAPELTDVQRLQDIGSGRWGRSWIRSQQRRPQTEFKVDSHAFLPDLFRGDHSLRMGVRYRRTTERGTRHPGGYATARVDNGIPVEADLHRDAAVSKGMHSWGVYASNSYERHRFRLNVGARVDYQDDAALPTSTLANPIVPDWLPSVTFPGGDSGVSYLDISPRIGATYDVTGTGRTVAKASAAIYYGQGIFTAEELTPGGDITTVRFPWRDANSDGFVQRNELDLQRLLFFSANYDPSNPLSLSTATTVDSDLANERTSEVIAGIEHELLPNMAVGATYIWRRYDRFDWSPKVGLSNNDYIPVTRSFNCGNSTCDQQAYAVTFYELPFTIPARDILTNRDFDRRHNGWEFTVRRRLVGRWMLNGSIGLNDTRQYIGEYEDPTNVEVLHGAQDNARNARWIAKLTGMYALPAGIRVAGFFQARQGYPLERTIRSPTRTGGIGRVNVNIDRFGDVRLDDLRTLDLRVEKTFTVRRIRAIASLDVFNVGNADTVLRREGVQNLATANSVVEILAPRIARVGLRFVF
jgi:hypothetical protein